MTQIINKNTNKVLTVSYEFSKQNLIAHYGINYIDWLEVPQEFWGKDITVSKGKIILKPLDTVKLKQQALDYLDQRIKETKAEKFVQEINIADGRAINILTDLLEATLSSWLILKNKSTKDLYLDSIAIKVRYLTVTDNDTKRNEFVPITDEEINRLQGLLTDSIDNLEHLTVNITNEINSASDKEVKKVFDISNKEEYIKKLILKCTPQA